MIETTSEKSVQPSRETDTNDLSYANHGYWRRYQEHLPAKLRLGGKAPPTEHWWSWQGHQVHFDRMKPDEPHRTKVLLIHGGGGNGRLLMPFGTALRDAGYESLAPDLPGYGLTRLAEGVSPDYHLWLDLLAALVAREKSQEPERPLVVIGLSVGGMTGYLTCAGGANVDGVIATNLLDMNNPEVRHQSARSTLLSRIGGGMMFGMPWLFDQVKLPVWMVAPLDKMSVNRSLVRLLTEDPHIGKVRMPSKFFRTLAATQPPTDNKWIRRCPILLAHPDADLWTPTELSRNFFDKIESDQKEMVLLENAGHFPIEEPGLSQLLDAVVGFLDGIEAG